MQKKTFVTLNEEDIKEAISEKYHCELSEIEFIIHSDICGETSINAIFEENIRERKILYGKVRI